MTTALEQAAAAFLTARIDTGALLTAHPFAVRAATQRADLPSDRFVILAAARQDERSLADLLDFQLATQIIAYPALATHDETALALVERAIREAWESSGAADAWDTAVQAAIPGWHDGGLYPGQWEPASEENQWTPGYTLSIGIARDGV